MMPDGRLGHAEIVLGDCVIMLSDDFPGFCGKAPPLGGSAVSIHLYVGDVDAFSQKAVAAGATERKPVMEQFYGDRSGQLEIPLGISGGWPRLRRTSRRRRCGSAWRRCSRRRSKRFLVSIRPRAVRLTYRGINRATPALALGRWR
jgi:hypothetical protein